MTSEAFILTVRIAFFHSLQQLLSHPFAQVQWTSTGVRFICTDDAILDAILVQLKKYDPKYIIPLTWELISGETICWKIEKLQAKDMETGLWLVKQLCQQGWEPFESERIELGSGSGFVSLRRVV